MAAQGVNAVATRAIAEAAGTQQSVLHYSFGTREDLLRAVTEALTDDVYAKISTATAKGNTTEKVLASFVRVLVRGVQDRPGHHLLLLELTLLSLRQPGLADLAKWQYAKYEQAAGVALERICAQTGSEFIGDRGDGLRFVLAVLDGFTIRELVDGDPKAATAGLKRLTALLASMLRPAGALRG